MMIGPVTWPCIDTDLCNPGTTSGHLAISGEDECTSRLQRKEVVTEGLEQEACMPPASRGGLMMEDFREHGNPP